MNPTEKQISNSHDHHIDATLAALREAALAPSGLEQRVLRKLAEQTTRKPRAGWLLAGWTLPAAACAVLLFLAIPALHQTHGTPRQAARNTSFSAGLMPLSSPAPAEQFLVREVPSRHSHQPRSHRLPLVARDQTTATRVDTPSPPAPLTEQERLLLQIARSGDPQQRAMLDPEVLARQESERDAEFRNFFAKSSNSSTANP